MELEAIGRQGQRKGEAKQLRREGMIPAVLYGGKEAHNLAVSRPQFEAALRNIEKGALSTVVFTLKTEQGDVKALVKEVQYHVTTYDILHLDFQEVHDDVPVNVKVPLRFIGGDDSPGVKLGGVVREVIRKLPVTCLPADIPGALTLDVSTLGMAQTKRLSDIELPPGVAPRARKMDEVAVVIAKR